jgi:DNA-binding transcriptional ArsR family regulator
LPQAAEIFRVLADPTRLAIYESLVRRESSVLDLTARFDVSQPAVSQHLAVLRTSGLVAHRKQGRHVFYRAEVKGMKPFINWLSHYQAFWREKLPRLRGLLKEMENERQQGKAIHYR